MRNDIREELIQIARYRSLVSYDDLNRELGLGLGFEMPPDRNLIGS